MSVPNLNAIYAPVAAYLLNELNKREEVERITNELNSIEAAQRRFICVILTAILTLFVIINFIEFTFFICALLDILAVAIDDYLYFFI